MVASPPSEVGTPRVSVVIPVYRSARTLERCLDALRRQTFTDFETVVVDSSPDDSATPILARFPAVRVRRSRRRLLPQLARRAGVELARGALLVHIDPDVYAAPDWLARLVAHFDAQPRGVVVGALECHGRRWLDLGVHLCKFSKWLPGRGAATVDMGPTANLLIDREVYEEAGGVSGDDFFGDATLSWTLTGSGHRLAFAADAAVEHHHLSTFPAFLAERFGRGIDYGRLRLAWRGAGRSSAAWLLLVTVLPLRLASNLAHVARHAADAARLGDFLRTSPVVVAGFAASLAGEAISYARALVSPPPPAWATAR